MAKKTNTVRGKGSGSFSELNDFLNTVAPDGEILDINPIAKIDEWIPSGSFILNAAISGSLFGGIPNRRSFVLAGEEGTGKTFIAMSICRNAIKRGYSILYFDSEGAIDIDFVKKLGVDTSKVRLQPVYTIEEFSTIVAKITKQFDDAKAAGIVPPKIMIVLDSLGNLSSTKETTDTVEGSDKRDMTKQQNIRKLFRVNGLQLAKHGIPFIINNHVYASMSMFTPKEISGGGGVKYNASIIFVLGKGKLEDAEGEKIAKKKNVDAVKLGITIYITPYKNRYAKPIKVQFHIPFYKPINPYIGLEKFVSWETCGVVRGKALPEKEYLKLTDNAQKKCFPFQSTATRKVSAKEWGQMSDIDQKKCTELDAGGKTPKYELTEDVTFYAEPSDTARTLVVKHENGEVPLGELFTKRVFTEAVLHELDEKVIKPTFMLPTIETLDDLAELTATITDDEIGNGDED